MSYWCDEQLVVTVTGPAGRRVISLDKPFARVGSHPKSEVLLEGKSIPTRCLYLHATPAGVFCLFLDLHANDGNTSDGQRGRWLAPDEDLALGPYRVRASLLTAEAGDAVPTDGLAVWGSAPRPLPVLLVYVGDLLKDKRRFRARLSPIGRRPQCALQLKGQNVSGFHCVLYWHDQQLWCIDLNASNGTEINGAPVDCARVMIGDRLEVGEFGLVFQRLSYGKAGIGKPQATTAAARSLEQNEDENDENPAPTPLVTAAPAPLSATAPLQTVAPPALAVANRAAEEAARRAQELAEELRAAEAARTVEQQQLRDKLNEEVARLAQEREELHSTWEHTSHDLKSQIGQLHEEATRLAAQRQALEQSRQEWQAERAALATELTRRSDQLGHLEAELAAATALLNQKLAAAQTPPVPLLAPVQTPPTPSPEELARLEEQRQLRAELAAQVEQMARERQELQARWEQSTDQLRSQLAELSSRSQELLHERDTALQSRHEWETERAKLAAQLAKSSDQLAHLEADLKTATTLLAQKLAAVPSTPAQPSPEQLTQLHEQERRQADLEQEIKQLAHERQALQARWEQSTEELRDQVAQLTTQSEQLLRERDGAQESRIQWEAEHARLAAQLGERSDQLARLESELATVTASFAGKLAALESQAASSPAIAPPADAPPFSLAAPQPTAVVTDQQPVRIAEPIDDALESDSAEPVCADEHETAAAKEAPLDVAAIRTPATASSSSSEPAQPPDGSEALAIDVASTPEDAHSDRLTKQPAPHIAPAASPGFSAPVPLAFADRDRLPLLVSDRLVELDQTDRRRQILWWSAGGIGVAAIIAIAVTLWQWLF
jgi:colicin import membrane protein